MSVNYDSVCRLCLTSRCELLPIFSTTSSDDGEPLVLASKIKECVSVQINENDVLPTNVCRKCLDNVNNWHIFKTVCERTQNKLQSLINKESNQLEEVQIKSEPLTDDAYDDGVVIDGSYADHENAGSTSKFQPEGPPILASLGLTPRSDKKYVDPRMDWQRVHAILHMVQDDDTINSLQMTEECDVEHTSDHDSDTDIELNSDLNDEFLNCKNGYLCKNKVVLSKNPKLSSTSRLDKVKRVINLRKRHMKPKYYPQPKDAWQMLISDDLLEMIVTSTNEKITNTVMKHSTITDIGEIKTVIGILYYHGIMRPTYQKMHDLWHSDFGVKCVQNAMKYERFKFLLENMRFDTDDCESIIGLDVMRRIRKAFEIFALNCRTSFDVGNTVVLDEVLLPVQGPCPFRYKMERKALKTGIKVVLIVDPDNFYVSNLDVITDPYFDSNEIAKKLLQHLTTSWKTVIMDNWFFSTNLMDTLLKDYKLFTIGALKEKDSILPPIFLSHYRKNMVFLTGFLNENISITSYVNTDSKTINVVSNDPSFYKRGHGDYTTATSHYKKNQSVVEVLDVLMNYYTTTQNTNDWPLSLFFMLLNIAAVNAQVMWTSGYATKAVVQRRLFIRELAISLMETKEPFSPNSSQLYVKKKSFSTFEHMTPSYKSRRRCKICITTTKKDRRTRMFCCKCGMFICREHTASICIKCG